MPLGSYQSLCLEHQAARADFLAAAGRVAGQRWNTAIAAGKWSPAQVAEHLRLGYVVLGGELRAQPGLRVRTNWWQRALVRWKFLGGILDHGVIPKGARAPRELQPGPGPFEQARLLADLDQVAGDFEVVIGERWNRPGPAVTHHVFGKLKADQAFRFATVHLNHHRSQLPK